MIQFSEWYQYFNAFHIIFFLIDRIKIDLLNQEYTVYYVGTNLGHVYKIVQFYRNNEPHSKLLVFIYYYIV